MLIGRNKLLLKSKVISAHGQLLKLASHSVDLHPESEALQAGGEKEERQAEDTPAPRGSGGLEETTVLQPCLPLSRVSGSPSL